MRPPFCLANAESVDPTVSNLMTVLACIGIILAVGAVAFVPVIIAWRRGHRQSEALMAAAVLWGVLAAVSAISTTLEQMKYSHQHQLLVQSGYYDPNDVTDAPQSPWVTWAILAGGYGVLVLWAALARPASQESRP